MSPAIQMYSFKPDILTAVGFDRKTDFREQREAWGDAIKTQANQLSAGIRKGLVFSKTLDSEGEMIISAEVGAGETYLISLGRSALRATACRVSGFDFFTQIVAPIFVDTLKRLDCDELSLLGVMFQFSLMASDDKAKEAEFLAKWPVGGGFKPTDCKTNDIQGISSRLVYKGAAGITHIVGASLEVTGRPRVRFAIDTRKESREATPSVQSLCSFYAGAEKYVTDVLAESMGPFFETCVAEH